jgi:alanine racemase
MDMFMCDITGVDAKINDQVTVFDPINNAKVWKYYCDSSEYEVLTNLKTSRMKVVIKQ